MAAKKKSTKIDANLRGLALVERAIAALAIRKPRPVPPARIAKLTLGGKPLPPSLRRWLAHHDALPRPFGTRLLEGEGLVPSPWSGVSQRALARDSELADLETHVPGKTLPLDMGDEQFRVLLVGEADAAGEYPVLDIDIGYGPTVTLALPGFDVWLAVVAGVLEARKARTMYSAAIAEHARINFGGAEQWEKRARWGSQKKAMWEPPPRLQPTPRKPMDAATELVWAVREGELETVRDLLDEGISPSSVSKACDTCPIHAAASSAQPRMMELLLDRGAQVDQIDGRRTPLHVLAGMDWWWYSKTSPALLDRWLACLRLLLARGADIEARDESRWTPLHLAAGRRSLALVGLLVDHGADVNATTNFGRNALHELLVVPGGRKTQPAHDVVACLELLLARGIDATLADKGKDTPLALAKQDREMPEKVFELLNA